MVWDAQELADHVNRGFFKAKIAHEAKIQDMLKMTDVVVPMLSKMVWMVLHAASESTTFITTDSPVRLLPPYGVDLGPYGVGFGMAGTRTLFPLSASACLVMVNQSGPPLVHGRIGRAQMRAINRLQALGAYEYVIGRDEALVRNLVERLDLDTIPIASKLRVN